MLVLSILLISPIVHSLIECSRITQVSDIPCMIVTSWKPVSCNVNLSVLNSSAGILYTQTMGDYADKCNGIFNITQDGIYTWNSSIETGTITVEAKDSMATLSVGIFILLVNIGIFAFGFYGKFSKNEVFDFLIKRCIYIIGVVLLWFNTSIFMTFAKNNGLGIQPQMNTYFLMISICILAGIVYIVYTMLTTPLKIWKQISLRNMMGEDNHNIQSHREE